MARYLAVEGRILLLSCSDRALILHINNALIPYYVLLGCRLNTGLHPGDKEGRGGAGRGGEGRRRNQLPFFYRVTALVRDLERRRGRGRARS